MKVHNYTVRIHGAGEGGYWADVPAIPGCFTQGKSLDEIKTMAKEAIEGYLEGLKKHRRVMTKSESENDVVGTLEVQVRVPVA